MTRKRLKKKILKFWLQEVLIDASQSPYWRSLLFQAGENEPFRIDKDHVEGLPEKTIEAMKRYGLSFYVAKVPKEKAEPWLSEGSWVIFKFWCADYPAVYSFSWCGEALLPHK